MLLISTKASTWECLLGCMSNTNGMCNGKTMKQQNLTFARLTGDDVTVKSPEKTSVVEQGITQCYKNQHEGHLGLSVLDCCPKFCQCHHHQHSNDKNKASLPLIQREGCSISSCCAQTLLLKALQSNNQLGNQCFFGSLAQQSMQ